VHGRHELRQARLQHIVARATLERLDRALLAERAGDKDERDVREKLLRKLERREAVEGRQVVVGQDEVRHSAREDAEEILARIDAFQRVRQSELPQGEAHQFGIGNVVLNEDDA
jgi:hypothetical protein